MHNPRTAASLLFALAALTFAQQSIVPSSASSTFPACAVNCAVLLQAQQTCTAASTQLAQDNCFCQSSPVNSLQTTPDQVCTAECPNESDRTELQSWFSNFCSQVAQGIDPVSGSTTPTPTSAQPSASVVVVTITSTNPVVPTASGTGTATASGSSSSNKTWIQEHWKWVMAIAIILVGLLVLAFLAVCLKRRHRRKLEEARARAGGFPTPNEKRYGARSATPELWGPHQHMAATQGWDYQDYPRDRAMEAGVLGSHPPDRERRKSRRHSSSKGKAKDRVSVTEVSSGLSTQPSDRDRQARELDENGRSKSQRRRERERERSKGKEVEQKLRGIKSRDRDDART